MQVLHLNKVTANYTGRTIFSELNWAVNQGDRIGLVGPNGAGKSTLLKLVVGALTPESGVVQLAKGVRVGYLPQHPELPPGRTVWNIAQTYPPQLAAADAALNAVEARLADPDTYNDEKRLARALADQEQALAKFEALGGLRFPARMRELLRAFGFGPEDEQLGSESLSGGQKKLLALALLAADVPELLLLDEPDNHIDLEAKRHLEAFIRSYPGAVIIVSHDRYLLDECVTQIAELDAGTLTAYTGNYTAYTEERVLRRLRQQALYVAQQKRIAQIEEAIHRFELSAKATENERHAKQARHRRRMLERMETNGEMIDKVVDRKPMDLQIEGWRGSTKAVELKGVSMAFGDDLLFTDVDLLLRHGERLGLIGPNGAGKSVLFSLILGQHEPLDGVVKLGPSVRVGHYAQEHQTLAPWLNRTPVEFAREFGSGTEGEAVHNLLKFRFTYQQARDPISDLSGGERSRLQLMAIMLQKPNLLLLDEPTNNLDMLSAEALEAALDDFEGSVLIISHDRYFLDQIVDRVAVLENGGLSVFEGGYSDLIARRNKQRPVKKTG